MFSKRLKVTSLAAFVALALAGCFGSGPHPTSGPGGVPVGLYHLFGYDTCSVTAFSPGGGVTHEVHTDRLPGNIDLAFYGPLYFEVQAGDATVDNEGCLLRLADSVWDQKFSPELNGPFGNGMYRVGVEMAPGTYQAGTMIGFCSWSRLSSFDGQGSSIIQSGIGDHSLSTVTIAPTDVGFSSAGCRGWTKIG